MAADLHIHVMTDDCTEEDIALFFSNHLGSKYFNPIPSRGPSFYEEDWYKRVGDSPSVWVGEVSWLKQAVFDVPEGEFVPDIVQSISDIVGEDLPLCDDELISRVKAAYSAAEKHPFYSVEGPNRVIEFLEAHKGKRLYTISW